MSSRVKDPVQDKPATLKKDGGCTGAVLEAYASFTDVAPHRLRQAQVAADGFFMGGIKQGQKQLFTWDTAGKVTIAVGGGLLFGALLASESPVIVGGALLLSGIGIGICATNTWKNKANKKGRDISSPPFNLALCCGKVSVFARMRFRFFWFPR